MKDDLRQLLYLFGGISIYCLVAYILGVLTIINVTLEFWFSGFIFFGIISVLLIINLINVDEDKRHERSDKNG